MTETFQDFQTKLLGRHEKRLTSALSTVGDVLWLAAVPAGLLARDVRVFVRVFALGTVVATGAHLFQPGTIKDEVTAVFTHPLWALRAEARRVARRT
jgi:hypothetical protein